MDRKYSSSFAWNYLEKKRDAFLICIPILFLLMITIPFISSSYGEDEIFSITISRSLSYLFGTFRNYENNMSAYYMALHIWMRFFGEKELATHSLSVLFALCTIPVFFKLERVWLSKTMALAGALLLVTNPLFTYYAVESRSYSLLLLSATLSTWVFIRLLHKPSYRLAILYGLLAAAGVYTHYFAVLIVLVHALAIYRKKLSRLQLESFFLSGLILLMGVLPLLLFPPRNSNQVDWISKPGFPYLYHTFADLFGGGRIFWVLILCLFFVLKKGYWKSADERGYFLLRLSLVWILIPVSLLFVFSNLVKPVFLTRFFIWCLPGSVMLSCLIIDYTGWNYILKTLVWLLLLSMLMIKSIGILRTKGSGYKEAVQYLNEHVQPGESVITYPYYKSGHIAYYLNEMHSAKKYAGAVIIAKSAYLLGGGGRDPDPDMESLGKIAAKSAKVYLVCRFKEGPAITDSIQNRNWIPEIEKIIAVRHPAQQNMVFGTGSDEPVRIIIYK